MLGPGAAQLRPRRPPGRCRRRRGGGARRKPIRDLPLPRKRLHFPSHKPDDSVSFAPSVSFACSLAASLHYRALARSEFSVKRVVQQTSIATARVPSPWLTPTWRIGRRLASLLSCASVKRVTIFSIRWRTKRSESCITSAETATTRRVFMTGARTTTFALYSSNRGLKFSRSYAHNPLVVQEPADNNCVYRNLIDHKGANKAVVMEACSPHFCSPLNFHLTQLYNKRRPRRLICDGARFALAPLQDVTTDPTLPRTRDTRCPKCTGNEARLPKNLQPPGPLCFSPRPLHSRRANSLALSTGFPPRRLSSSPRPQRRG